MRIHWAIALTSILLLKVSSASGYADQNKGVNNPWTLEKEQSNIKIYTREVSSSPYLQVKAEVQLNAPQNAVLKQFSNTGNCWKWQTRCASTKILETHSDTEQTVQTIIDMPWPLSDREMVFKTRLTADKTQSLTRLELTPFEGLKESKKWVRARSTIEYMIKANGQNSTSLGIKMHTDFGGDVSASFINGRLVDALLDDVNALIMLTASETD